MKALGVSGGFAAFATARGNRQTLGGRIKAIRQQLGMTQAQFARHFPKRLRPDQSAVSNWERDKDRPNDERLVAMAEMVGADPGELTFGQMSQQDDVVTPVVGYVGAGNQIFPIDDHGLGGGIDVVDLVGQMRGRDLVAVTVRGDSMLPLKDGWRLLYERDSQAIPSRCINRLCVCATTDGAIYVKELRPGYKKGRFNLRSWNAADMDDVELNWAAPVELIQTN